MRNLRFVTCLAVCLICLPMVAQPQNPQNPVPLDGGLSLLVAAGLAYAANSISKISKNSSNDTQF